jgi:predicted phosphodiesterase
MEVRDGIDLGGRRMVAAIADTHADGPPAGLPPAIVEALVGTDLILHAGDIGSDGVVAALEEIAPVLAVRGNDPSDRVGGMGQLPRCRRLEIAGHTIVLTHGDIDVGWAPRAGRGDRAPLRAIRRVLGRTGVRTLANGFVLARLMARFQGRADCVVFGHTHIPTATRLGSTLYVNPGDAQYRAHRHLHLALLHIEPGNPIRAELVTLELANSPPTAVQPIG